MKRRDFDWARFAFVFTAILVFFLAAYIAGIVSGLRRDAGFEAFHYLRGVLMAAVTEYESVVAGKPIHFLQPSRQPGAGVTVNERAGDGRLVLVTGFFGEGAEVRLMRRDGEIVARWPARFSHHFPEPDHLPNPPATDRNVDIHGVVANPDGSIVFNYEFAGAVKVSRCGDVIWRLDHPTHHSVEKAAAGGYWIPGRIPLARGARERLPPFTIAGAKGVYGMDVILRVSEDGEILRWASVARLLYDNGLEALLTSTGYDFPRPVDLHGNPVHLNKVGELPAALADRFPGFEAGDLVLSLRRYNLVLVVDPDDWRVKWWRIGPWLRQHDPEFTPEGEIAVFNNNAYRDQLLTLDRSDPAAPRVSNIVAVDPGTGRTRIVYGGVDGQRMHTVIRGKHERTQDGGYLIAEFEAGRVFEIDAGGRLVWEYINRYDADWTLEVTEARLYDRDYFEVADWRCPG